MVQGVNMLFLEIGHEYRDALHHEVTWGEQRTLGFPISFINTTNINPYAVSFAA